MKLLLILLTDFLIIIHIVRGEECWINLVCDGTPLWRNITTCNQEMQAEAINKLYKTELQKMTDKTVVMSKQLCNMRKMMKLLESRTGEAKAPETTSSDETTCDSTTPSNWKPEVSPVDQTPASQSTEVTTKAEEKEDTSDIDGTPEGKYETTLVDDASEDTTRTNEMTATAEELEAATDGAGSTEIKTVTIADTTLEGTAQNTDIETTGKTTTDIDANTEITSTTSDETTLEDATETSNMETTVEEFKATTASDRTTETEAVTTLVDTTAEVTTQTTLVETTVLCPIFYENKCFIPVLGPTVNQADARKICIGMSGKLADIYSEAHFNLIMQTVRANHMGGESYVQMWLGMTIDPTTGAVSLSNGESAPYLKWYPSLPYKTSSSSSYSTYTGIWLYVKSSTTKSRQYMFNNPPTFTYNTLCEI